MVDEFAINLSFGLVVQFHRFSDFQYLLLALVIFKFFKKRVFRIFSRPVPGGRAEMVRVRCSRAFFTKIINLENRQGRPMFYGLVLSFFSRLAVAKQEGYK